MCSFTLGHWIIPFLSILVVQIDTMKCFYCPQKDASVVLWDSLSPDDHWGGDWAAVPPPPPCASTAFSMHAGPSDRRFSDRSFRFPLMGPALFKHGDPSDRCLPAFQRSCARGRGGYMSKPNQDLFVLEF